MVLNESLRSISEALAQKYESLSEEYGSEVPNLDNIQTIKPDFITNKLSEGFSALKDSIKSITEHFQPSWNALQSLNDFSNNKRASEGNPLAQKLRNAINQDTNWEFKGIVEPNRLVKDEHIEASRYRGKLNFEGNQFDLELIVGKDNKPLALSLYEDQDFIMSDDYFAFSDAKDLVLQDKTQLSLPGYTSS